MAPFPPIITSGARTASPSAISTGNSPGGAGGCCRRAGRAALLAVVGPGILAGLSDDVAVSVLALGVLALL